MLYIGDFSKSKKNTELQKNISKVIQLLEFYQRKMKEEQAKTSWSFLKQSSKIKKIPLRISRLAKKELPEGTNLKEFEFFIHTLFILLKKI